MLVSLSALTSIDVCAGSNDIAAAVGQSAHKQLAAAWHVWLLRKAVPAPTWYGRSVKAMKSMASSVIWLAVMLGLKSPYPACAATQQEVVIC
jgi:formylmethanofuran dehydrogenase subunit E-like metal-binding protein